MITRIISGGQTGVDRAALDAALENNFPCGGWCPSGRRSEDGKIPVAYPLQETRSGEYEERTEKNVEDSCGTLILTGGAPTGGTALTVEFALKHGRPCLVIDVGKKNKNTISRVGKWIRDEKIEVLNVAGPRASKNPKIYDIAKSVVGELIKN